MNGNDLRSVRYTAGGACGVRRAGIVGLLVTTGATAGRLTITEGSGGTTKIDIDTSINTSLWINIPHGGVLFEVDPFISAITNITSVTIFFS